MLHRNPDAVLDSVLNALNAHSQRAMYGAVAAPVGRPARLLLGGRPRDARYSWIVSKDSGFPAAIRPRRYTQHCSRARKCLRVPLIWRRGCTTRRASAPVRREEVAALAEYVAAQITSRSTCASRYGLSYQFRRERSSQISLEPCAP